MNTATEAALSCEAKKHAYRQTQDGVVVSFVLHPQEVPDGLALAPLGTRFMLVAVEIGDDESPQRPRVAGAGTATAGRSTPDGNESGARNPGGGNALANSNARQTENESGRDNPAPGRTHKRSWHEMSPAQQAGIRCGERAFAAFLRECYPTTFSEARGDAAELVRLLCNVTSRAELKPGTPSAKAWADIDIAYSNWQLAPQVGAA